MAPAQALLAQSHSYRANAFTRYWDQRKHGRAGCDVGSKCHETCITACFLVSIIRRDRIEKRCRKEIGIVERSGHADATKSFAGTQRLRLVMYRLLELNTEVLSAANGSYIVCLDRRNSRGGFAVVSPGHRVISQPPIIALQGERLLPLNWDLPGTIKAQAGESRLGLNSFVPRRVNLRNGLRF
jgi:hypothetical protein